MSARLAIVLVALLALAGLGTPVPAALAGETVIQVEFVDEGTLDIGSGGETPAFLAEGEAPALTAFSPSVTATATFSLSIRDTRADERRAGYVVTLQATPFTTAAGGTIDPAHLVVTGVTGAPDGVPVAGAIGHALDEPVALLSVPDGAAAIDATLVITVAMTLNPGTLSGTYTGDLTFDVIPRQAP